VKHLEPKDIWPAPVYEGVRQQFRAELIEAKKHRRVSVGPVMDFLFENRLTVKFQVQEILRAEKITDPAQVAEELEGFNTMLPGPGELFATLMIAFSGSEAEVRKELQQLYKVTQHIWLEIQGRPIQADVEPGREEEERGAAAVQYMRFRVPDAQALQNGPAFLIVDHPRYNHRTELPESVRRSLAQDLS
jgi:hypothetical protein